MRTAPLSRPPGHGLHRRAPRPSRGVGQALAAALLAVALLPTAAAARSGQTVAVLPLVVHAMDEQDYLRTGLADMLASRLGRWSDVGVIRVDDPTTATTDAAAARAVGQELGADWVLFGSFTRFGDGASLDVRCLETASEEPDSARSVFVQAGRLGEIIPQLDGLAEKVARYVASGGTVAPDVAAAGPAVGGPGVDALRTELEALRERVEVIESILPGVESPEPVVERDLGAPVGDGARAGSPGADLARELR